MGKELYSKTECHVLSVTNMNVITGIRYGVISADDILETWADESEPLYENDRCCSQINCFYREEECNCSDGDCYCFDEFSEPIYYYIDKDGYAAHSIFDGSDIFITESPYFTYASKCSPCCPGACDLKSPLTRRYNNNKCYCFGPEWFMDSIPYNVYCVETGERLVVKKGEGR
jgi:hypothetical protein